MCYIMLVEWPVWWIHSILPISILNLRKCSISQLCAVDEDADGANYQYTSVDLNLHLMNQNGNLVAWGNDYIATCTPQGFACFGSSVFIFADCWQGDGNIISTSYDVNIISTSYDVNKNVQNNNGFLAWNNC